MTGFAFTLFQNQYAHGSDRGSVQTQPYIEGKTFQEYIETLEDVRQRVFPKGKQPHILHAITTNGLKSADAIKAYTALTLDCDGTESLQNLEKFVQKWPCSWITQTRKSKGVWKYHLTLPFRSPIRAFPLWTPSVQEIIREFSRQIGDELDLATASTTALTGIYSRRAETDDLPSLAWRAAEGFDFDAVCRTPLTARRAYAPRNAVLTPVEGAPTTEMTEAFREAGLLGEWLPAKRAYVVECPHHHETQTKTKTLLFPAVNKVDCKAGNCTGRSTLWFVKALPEPQREKLLPRLGMTLPQAAPEVDLETAQTQIRAALGRVSPVERNAVLIRVTTGAGKSHAATQYLNDYSKPVEGAPGRTAVFGTPTNSLLRELDSRIHIPHVKQTGVLAVLNDDGTPACKKHDRAITAQRAGADIHRLFCAPCEFREGCPARDNRRTGEGALTMTNHALVPAVAEALHEKGRFPLLVWDESPEWVQTQELYDTDVEWLLGKFDDEAKPPVDAGERIMQSKIFQDQFRVAMRPILDFVRWLRDSEDGPIYIEGKFNAWCTRGKRPSLWRAAQACRAVRGDDPWEWLRAAVEGSGRIVSTGIPFDKNLPDKQREILRAEGTLKAVRMLLEEGTAVVKAPGGFVLASLTKNALLLREHGGVVMDATAPISLMKMVRPDIEIVDVNVEDDEDTERAWIFANLSRAALLRDPSTFKAAVLSLAQFTKRRKAVVFTYKDRVEEGKRLYPEADWHHYGDVRGHDRWYQQGYESFVTLGDPIPNLGAVQAGLELALDAPKDAISEYLDEVARAETAQAHGRARDPQPHLTGGRRVHIHVGSKPPLGWNGENAIVVVG